MVAGFFPDVALESWDDTEGNLSGTMALTSGAFFKWG